MEPFIEPSDTPREPIPNLQTVTETSSLLPTPQVENSSLVSSSSSSNATRVKPSTKKQPRPTSTNAKSYNANNLSAAPTAKVKEKANYVAASNNQNGIDTKSANASTQDVAANEEDLIAFLNSSDNSGGINESLILKDEVENQARELKLITKNHRSLQKGKFTTLTSCLEL